MSNYHDIAVKAHREKLDACCQILRNIISRRASEGYFSATFTAEEVLIAPIKIEEVLARFPDVKITQHSDTYGGRNNTTYYYEATW